MPRLWVAAMFAATTASAALPALFHGSSETPPAAASWQAADSDAAVRNPAPVCVRLRHDRDSVERRATRMSVDFQEKHDLEDAVDGIGGKLFLGVILSLKGAGDAEVTAYIALRDRYRDMFRISERHDCGLPFRRRLDPILDYLAEHEP